MFTCVLLTAAALAGSLTEAVDALRPIRSGRLAVEAPEIPLWAYEKAESGSTVAGLAMVDGQPIAKGWGVRVADVPIEAAWMALSDEAAFTDRFRVTTSKVITGERARTGRTVFQFMPVPIIRDRWWIVEVTHNAALFTASEGRLWEKKVSDVTDPLRLEGLAVAAVAEGGIPVDWTRGAWLLQQLGPDRTLLEYFVWTDIGGRIPAGPVSRFAKGAIRDNMDTLSELATERVGTPRAGFVRPDGTPL